MVHTFDSRGFAMVRGLMDPDAVEETISTLGDVSGAGQRGMLRHDFVRRLAGSEIFLTTVQPFLPAEANPRPVRAILFDKSPGSNWLVSWHQDLTIAVTARGDVPGFGPWSVKDGIVHVQPPAALLEGMITLRLHLDDADETNGALRVIPGSHCHGRLSPSDVGRLRSETPEVICHAGKGDALLMRPLILHASGRSTTDRRRRVLHIEYAGCDLPNGLRWNDAA